MIRNEPSGKIVQNETRKKIVQNEPREKIVQNKPRKKRVQNKLREQIVQNRSRKTASGRPLPGERGRPPKSIFLKRRPPRQLGQWEKDYSK